MKTRNKVLIGGAVVVIAYLLWNRSKKKNNLTVTNVASGNTSTAPTNESSNLDLPTGMDLPNLTPSTNVPTETALNNSLVAPIDKSAQLAEEARLAEERRLAGERLAEQARVAEIERSLSEYRAEQSRLAEYERVAQDERLRQLMIYENEKNANQIISANNKLKPALPYESPSISASVDIELFAPQQYNDATQGYTISGGNVGGGAKQYLLDGDGRMKYEQFKQQMY